MKPNVLVWFKVYCAVLALLYLFLVALGVVYLVVDPAVLGKDAMEIRILGVLFVAMGIPLAVASALPFFVRPARWVWVYGMVLICIGMTSCCFVPACVPLLVYWMKPETKAYFGL
jgi:hypothetical protein